MNDNKIKQSSELVVIVFVILVIISFIPVKGEFWGVEFKQIDLFSDLKPEQELLYEDDDFFKDWQDEDINESADSSDQSSIQQGRFDKTNTFTAAMPFGELAEATYNFLKNENEKIDNYLSEPVAPRNKVSITGNTKQMKYFVDALKKSKREKVHIAHYGDSQIEGDLVSGDLRESLRKEFGGGGAGYLALTSQDISFRVTTKHEYPANKWKTGSVFMGNEYGFPYGISGESFVPNAGAYVSYTALKRYRSTSKFKEIYVFYSDAKGDHFKAVLDNKAQDVKLNKGRGLQMAEITSPGSVRSLKLEFPQNESATYYGVFLEDGNGVYVDNFPLRGNSGEDLQKIPEGTVKDFNKMRDYKLVIFQFGKNAMSGNYLRYEREMLKVIEKFQAAMPNTSFLLISVQDSGFKTTPRMMNLLKTQMNIAKSADIAFWNLFEAMGGANSMSKWVKNNPPLASADHTHFNLQGAQIVGDMMAEALIDLYNNMK